MRLEACSLKWSLYFLADRRSGISYSFITGFKSQPLASHAAIIRHVLHTQNDSMMAANHTAVCMVRIGATSSSGHIQGY